MTGGTVIMDLVVARIGEGDRWVDVTNSTSWFIDYYRIMISCFLMAIRYFSDMAGATGDAGAGGDGLINGQLGRGAVAVIDVGMTAGTVVMLGDDIAEGCQVAAAVIMTDCTTLPC